MTYRLDADKQKAILDWIENALGGEIDTVLWDKQDTAGSTRAIQPDYPFISLNIPSGPSKVGYATERYHSIDTFKYKFHKRFTLSVNIYSQNEHLYLVSKLLNSLELPSNQAILRNEGLSIWGVTDPLDISEIQDTSHELRVTFDVFFAYAEEETDKLGEIQKVGVKATGFEPENIIEIP